MRMWPTRTLRAASTWVSAAAVKPVLRPIAACAANSKPRTDASLTDAARPSSNRSSGCSNNNAVCASSGPGDSLTWATNLLSPPWPTTSPACMPPGSDRPQQPYPALQATDFFSTPSQPNQTPSKDNPQNPSNKIRSHAHTEDHLTLCNYGTAEAVPLSKTYGVDWVVVGDWALSLGWSSVMIGMSAGGYGSGVWRNAEEYS